MAKKFKEFFKKAVTTTPRTVDAWMKALATYEIESKEVSEHIGNGVLMHLMTRNFAHDREENSDHGETTYIFYDVHGFTVFLTFEHNQYARACHISSSREE